MLPRRRLLILLTLCVYAVTAYPASSSAAHVAPTHTAGVVAGSGWKYRVAAQRLPGIDNLVLAADGLLYATQELPNGAGKVIQLHRAEIKTVVSRLNRADGLCMRGKFLYITEETDDGRVLEFDLSAKKLRVLATLHRPEGIDILPGGDLVVSEDNLNGRLLRVRRDGRRAVEVIVGGLSRPEGVAVQPDGTVIFAETETGRVLSYKDGAVNVLLNDLDDPDQVHIAPDGALWITEDVGNGRLLRLKDGTLETVLSGLRSPQGMAVGPDGTVWLAERGRQRILVIRRHDGH